MEQHADYLMLGEKYARVLYLQSYPAYMRDDIIRELMELPRNMMLSIDYIPVPTDEAVRTVENKLLGVETNITNWQRKQNQNNNFSAAIPYDLNQQRQEANEFLDDLTTRDQRMLHMVLTLVHMADSREELDADTRTLVSTGNKLAYHFSTLRYQQLEGLNTALPYGLRKIDTLRTITTDPAATLMPFHAQEIGHLSWPEPREQEHDLHQPQAADERQRLHTGRQRLGQELLWQAGDRAAAAQGRRGHTDP